MISRDPFWRMIVSFVGLLICITVSSVISLERNPPAASDNEINMLMKKMMKGFYDISA
jgi:hypothetical protein